MKKEKLIQIIGKPILKPLSVLKLLLLMLFVSTPFVCIWHSWDLACKLGLTALFGLFIVYFVYAIIKKSIEQSVEQSVIDQIKSYQAVQTKSKFQKKLDEAMAGSKSANHVN